MTPDEFGMHDIRVCLEESDQEKKRKAAEKVKARRYVERSIADEAARKEILLALGLEEPDFWWEQKPGRRGEGSQIKHVINPPEKQEETNDATRSTPVGHASVRPG